MCNDVYPNPNIVTIKHFMLSNDVTNRSFWKLQDGQYISFKAVSGGNKLNPLFDLSSETTESDDSFDSSKGQYSSDSGSDGNKNSVDSSKRKSLSDSGSDGNKKRSADDIDSDDTSSSLKKQTFLPQKNKKRKKRQYIFIDDESNAEEIKISLKNNYIIVRKKKAGNVGVTCPVPDCQAMITFNKKNYALLPKTTVTHLEKEKEVVDLDVPWQGKEDIRYHKKMWNKHFLNFHEDIPWPMALKPCRKSSNKKEPKYNPHFGYYNSKKTLGYNVKSNKYEEAVYYVNNLSNEELNLEIKFDPVFDK